jgi:hypothetical protein
VSDVIGNEGRTVLLHNGDLIGVALSSAASVACVTVTPVRRPMRRGRKLVLCLCAGELKLLAGLLEEASGTLTDVYGDGCGTSRARHG